MTKQLPDHPTKRPPVLVSGLINVETTLRVEGFPIAYQPVLYPFGGVHSTVSGVGYNITRALTTLGDEVRFLSLIGGDAAGRLVAGALAEDALPAEDVLPIVPETAQSVIIYDEAGRRQINVDLKDIQERSYPAERFQAALAACELAVLCNINWNRPFLAPAAASDVIVASDVHTIGDLEDEYNADFMAAADILFMSDEALPTTPEKWAAQAQNRYKAAIIVIGLGKEGALLAVREDNFRERIPAIYTRPVVNSIGAGDALFSAFLHEYGRSRDPYAAIRRAVVFASYKIGTTGAASGFLTGPELDNWVVKAYG